MTETSAAAPSAARLVLARHGRLQGLVKSETVARYGAARVRRWRRNWAATPPGGESLKDAAARMLPYFRARVLPAAVRGASVLLVAHGNTLRVIAKDLEGLTAKQVERLDFATGTVLMYELSRDEAAPGKKSWRKIKELP